jgi:undecaprenyl-diphosphatase
VVQHFMGEAAGHENLILSVVLHLGTLVAVFIAFWRDIFAMIAEFFLTIRDVFTGRFSWKKMGDARRMMFMVIIATAMLIPVYLLRDFFTAPGIDNDIVFEGFAFLFTAMILFFSDACVKGHKTGKDMTVRDALTVGFFQIIAVLPGVSRSGSTISSGLFMGLSRKTAVTFAFILGIPAILGGGVAELGDALKENVTLDVSALLIGAAVAAVVGFLAIKLVSVIINHDKFKIFAVYTLLLGLFCIGSGIYEHFSGQTVFQLIADLLPGN